MALADRLPASCCYNGEEEMKKQLMGQLQRQLEDENLGLLLQHKPEQAKRELDARLELLMGQASFKDMPEAEKKEMQEGLIHMMMGLGPIQKLLDDPEISEVMVNGPDSVYVERGGRIERSDVCFANESQLRAVIDRIVAPLGRRVDEQSPMVDARLPQGHRVNVVLPPLSLDGPLLTVRKFRERGFSLADMQEAGTLSEELAQLLSWAVRGRKSLLLSGGTGAGKTTLLSALSAEIDAGERIVTIEDSAELRFDAHPHVLRLETRAKNAEGLGELGIRDLLRNALRMRPDRIIVGECRGAEALDMLQAMNTGHDGSMSTLHANSPVEAVARLLMMARFGMDLPLDVIREQIGMALDLIVQLGRFPDGSRRVTELACCDWDADAGVRVSTIAKWDGKKGCYCWSGEPDWLEELRFCALIREEELQRWREGTQVRKAA